MEESQACGTKKLPRSSYWVSPASSACLPPHLSVGKGNLRPSRDGEFPLCPPVLGVSGFPGVFRRTPGRNEPAWAIFYCWAESQETLGLGALPLLGRGTWETLRLCCSYSPGFPNHLACFTFLFWFSFAPFPVFVVLSRTSRGKSRSTPSCPIWEWPSLLIIDAEGLTQFQKVLNYLNSA